MPQPRSPDSRMEARYRSVAGAPHVGQAPATVLEAVQLPTMPDAPRGRGYIARKELPAADEFKMNRLWIHARQQPGQIVSRKEQMDNGCPTSNTAGPQEGDQGAL